MREASPLLPQRSLLRRLGSFFGLTAEPAAPAPAPAVRPMTDYMGPGTRGSLFALIVVAQLRTRHDGLFTAEQLRIVFDTVVDCHESHYRVED